MTGSAGTPRRVSFVIGHLNSGGAERAALNLAQAASRSKCQVFAEYRGGDLYGGPETADVVFVSDDLAAADRITRILRLARALRADRPDIVVSMLSPLVTVTAARLAGASAVHWLQAPWRETTRAGANTPTGAVQRWLLRTAVRGSSVVAAATPGLCDECRSLGIPDSKLALLPNGLQMPPLFNNPRSRDSPTRIVTVGRLEPQKRHDLTIRAVAALVARPRVPPLRLTVVGTGRDEPALRGLATSLGIGEIVDFVGFIPNPYVELQAADVFVLATDHEGFGNVIVEALAAGLPIVVSDVPHGPRFILDDGRYGALVAHNSVEALAAALSEAVDHAPLDDATVAAHRARAAAFAIEPVAERFEQLLDLVQKSRMPVPPAYRRWP